MFPKRKFIPAQRNDVLRHEKALRYYRVAFLEVQVRSNDIFRASASSLHQSLIRGRPQLTMRWRDFVQICLLSSSWVINHAFPD